MYNSTGYTNVTDPVTFERGLLSFEFISSDGIPIPPYQLKFNADYCTLFQFGYDLLQC